MQRPTPDQAWQQALAAADKRQTLILRLADECGLRRAEIAGLHQRDLTEGMSGWQLRVHGKGDKPRVVPIASPLAEVIQACSSECLLPNRHGGHLTPNHLARIAQKVLPMGWTLHTLRHLFATRAYRGSRNLRAVQTLLGHAIIGTTERYLACDDDEVRAAMMSALSAPAARNTRQQHAGKPWMPDAQGGKYRSRQ